MFKRVVIRVAQSDKSPSTRDSAAKVLQDAFPHGPKEIDMLVIDLSGTSQVGLLFLDECVTWYQRHLPLDKTTLIFRSAPEEARELLGRLCTYRDVKIYGQDHPGFPSYPIERLACDGIEEIVG